MLFLHCNFCNIFQKHTKIWKESPQLIRTQDCLDMIFQIVFRQLGQLFVGQPRLHLVCQISNTSGMQTVCEMRSSSNTLEEMVHSKQMIGWIQFARKLVLDSGKFSVVLACLQAMYPGCCQGCYLAGNHKYQHSPSKILCSFNVCALPRRPLELWWKE